MKARTHNQDARLIFVDGFAGSGKSTAAQRLWLHYKQHGHDASWLHEHEFNHPIFPYDAVEELLGLEPRPFEELLIANWEKFAQDPNAPAVRILEGSFFQITAGVMLSLNVTPSRIEKTLFQIEAIVSRLKPSLIYLYYQDTRAGLLRIREHRGEYWLKGMTELLSQSRYGRRKNVHDIEGLFEFYLEQRIIVESVFSRLRMKKTALEISGGDWTDYYRRMASFLKIGAMRTLDTPPKTLVQYVGAYKGTVTGNECLITTDAKSLYFHGSGSTAEKLLPVGAGLFCVQSRPIELRFDRLRNGFANRINFNCRISDPRITDTTWVRL